MENNRDELLEQGGDPMFGDEFDLAKASAPFQTLKRLMHTARHERLRLVVVLFSVILYTALSIAAPAYSAGIVNLLWENIQTAQGLGEAFRVTWQQGGQQIFILFLLYFGSWAFFPLQAVRLLSGAEPLSLR